MQNKCMAVLLYREWCVEKCFKETPNISSQIYINTCYSLQLFQGLKRDSGVLSLQPLLNTGYRKKLLMFYRLHCLHQFCQQNSRIHIAQVDLGKRVYTGTAIFFYYNKINRGISTDQSHWPLLIAVITFCIQKMLFANIPSMSPITWSLKILCRPMHLMIRASKQKRLHQYQ